MSNKDFCFSRRDLLKMGATVTAASVASGCVNSKTGKRPSDKAVLSVDKDQSLNTDWLFFRGAGEGFESPDFDDGGWRLLDLPHDWSIEDAPSGVPGERLGPFVESSESGSETGYTLGGEGWYRKRFSLPELSDDSQVELLLEGVSVLSDIWLNGRPVSTHVYGYTPYSIDLTPHIRRDEENVLALRVRNIGHNSRWYAGSGIYRPVSISVFPKSARIARWGVAAWTKEISGNQAEIGVTTTLDDANERMTLLTRLRDANGKVAAELRSPATNEVHQTLHLDSPRLWSISEPNLYQLETVLLEGSSTLDRDVSTFGVRVVNFDADNGLRINGESIKVRGGCIHHDNGILGAAAFADAEERRVRLLKRRGFNAIRSSHNPCSMAFRDACDRLGMLLIEESFDMWHAEKLPDDYSNYFEEYWRKDTRAMVLSARNSPCVIMWSIGNEVPERSTPEGVEWCWHQANEVHQLDPTRPVTAAINGSPGRPLIAAEGTARPGHAGEAEYASSIFLDVVGYNYKLNDFKEDHAKYPQRVFYASETYPSESYDYWALAEEAPYMIGEFVWTAMDYLGEAGLGLFRKVPADNPRPMPHEFPVVGAFCGDLDLTGEQKPQSLARDVVWGLSPLEVAVAQPLEEGMVELVPHWGWPDELQSWTWPQVEGREVTLRVYTSGDEVEVRVNGEQVGRKALSAEDKMRCELNVAYRPGELEVIAYQKGSEISRRRLQTVTRPRALRLVPEEPQGSADRQSIHYVRIEVLDEKGRWVPNDDRNVKVSIAGPAELLGFGSGNPRAVGSFQKKEALTYQGRALLILRSKGRKGDVRLTATADGLKASDAVISLG